MPKNLSNFPVLFDDKELEYLKGSPFSYQVLRKKKDIEADYHKICEAVSSF